MKRETVNRKESICVPRIFVQAKFSKPLSPPEIHLPERPVIQEKDQANSAYLEAKRCNGNANDRIDS